MRTIRIENVLKVIDILESEVSPTLIKWFDEQESTYIDNSEMGEDLYTAYFDDEEELAKLSDSDRLEFDQIRQLANDNDASYIRFVIS